MHSAIGLWVLIPFLLMCLTGLYWSYDWYRSAMFTIMQVEQPKRQQQQPQQAQAPQQQEASKEQGEKRQQKEAKKISFDNPQKAADIFNQNVLKDYTNARLSLAANKEGFYTISYLYADATHNRETNSMQIDVKNSLVVKEAKYSDKKLNEKIMSSMLPVHSGEFFGWIGQLIFFISSMLMALFVITGYMLYYQRWKKKREKRRKNIQNS